MSTIKKIALFAGVPFAALTVYAISQVGYMGILDAALQGPGSWQIFADLVVALLLVCSWMIVDARKKGRNVWPYLVVTLLTGSFGPLAYILLAPAEQVAATSMAS